MSSIKISSKVLGRMHACIAGDRRYSDTVSLLLEGDEIIIKVESSYAVGGMDSFYGESIPEESFRTTLSASDSSQEVMRSLRAVLSNEKFAFKQYGKPTKRFTWTTHYGYQSFGLRLNYYVEALIYAKQS